MAEMADSILYEDNHVLVAVKPPNMLSQADSTRDPDILTLLKEYLREKYLGIDVPLQSRDISKEDADFLRNFYRGSRK